MTRALVSLCAALALLVLAPAAEAQTPFRTCNRLGGFFAPIVIDHHHNMHRSTTGNPGVDSAVWDTNTIESYHRAWESFWYLDTTRNAIWIDEVTSGDTFTSWMGSSKVVHRANFNSGVFGVEQSYFVWPSNAVDHLDIYVSGPTSSVPRSNPAVLTVGPHFATSCVFPQGAPSATAVGGFTENVTLMHELGHGYGYGHFDSWISVENTSQIDSPGCELGTSPGPSRSMFLSPDGLLTQCHDLVYDIAPGIDLGLTPVVQPAGCNLAATGCATIPGPGVVTIPSTSTSFSASVQFTAYSFRDSVAGSVGMRVVLSRDRAVSSDDVVVFSGSSSSSWTAGATTRRVLSFTFNPQIAMPLSGTLYHALVQLDPTNAHAETRESNNVTDTNLFFVR